MTTAAENTSTTDAITAPMQSHSSQEGTPPSSDEVRLKWANRGYLISVTLAALFTAFSIIATFFIVHYSGRVGATQAAQIRQLERDRDVAIAETTKANAKIAEAQSQAEMARAEAAKANERAAEAELTLERLRTPRSLDDVLRERIRETAKPFGGTEFDFAVSMGDVEAELFGADLVNVLRSAGWIQVGWQAPFGAPSWIHEKGAPTSGFSSAVGIHLVVDPSIATQMGDRAERLASTLRSIGFAAFVQISSLASNPNTGAIHLLVGKKPI